MAHVQRSGRKLRLNHCNSLPRYLVCLSVDKEEKRLPGGIVTIVNQFKSATAITCRIDGTEPSRVKLHSMSKPEELWSLVDKFTAINHTTWLVGYDILYDLVCCGMPERFEQGKLVVDWPRSKRKREDNNDDNAHCGTLVVIENPPTIIAAKNSSTQGRLVAVDLQNWFSIKWKELYELVRNRAEEFERSLGEVSASVLPSGKYCLAILLLFTELMRWKQSNDLG